MSLSRRGWGWHPLVLDGCCRWRGWHPLVLDSCRWRGRNPLLLRGFTTIDGLVLDSMFLNHVVLDLRAIRTLVTTYRAFEECEKPSGMREGKVPQHSLPVQGVALRANTVGDVLPET